MRRCARWRAVRVCPPRTVLLASITLDTWAPHCYTLLSPYCHSDTGVTST